MSEDRWRKIHSWKSTKGTRSYRNGEDTSFGQEILDDKVAHNFHLATRFTLSAKSSCYALLHRISCRLLGTLLGCMQFVVSFEVASFSVDHWRASSLDLAEGYTRREPLFQYTPVIHVGSSSPSLSRIGKVCPHIHRVYDETSTS